MPDPLFKYYLLSAILILILIYIIQNLTLDKWDLDAWPFYISFGVILVVFLPFTWTHFLWISYISKYGDDEPKNKIILFFYNKSKFVTNNFLVRLLIYTAICGTFFAIVLIESIQCDSFISNQKPPNKTNLLRLLLRNDDVSAHCIIPWHMTETCALAIMASFLFLRMYMWIKLLYASLITIIYSYCVLNFGEGYFEDHETINYKLESEIAHVMTVVGLTIIFHLIDRQTEYMNRLDHLWHETLVEEQNKAQHFLAVNKMLLTNILPQHVAEIYLDVTASSYEPEQYEGVAVMFASLVDYSTDDMGQMFLSVMNQIIYDFDTLSVGDTFGRPIEKIKIAKWTYMAACGLAPGRGDTDNLLKDRKDHAVICLIKFASALMKKLQEINREALLEIKLRIGISYGSIAAGVVGPQKPLYDIWGDPVNMASRMDTNGLPNKIQVLQKTADIIESFGYRCNYRGMTKIKIKGPPEPVPTYFVDLDEDFNLQLR